MMRCARLTSRRLGGAVAVLMWFVLLGAVAGASTTTTPPAVGGAVAFSTCGLSPGTDVHIVSSAQPCVVSVPVGSMFKVALTAGWHWGNPTSSASTVRVSGIVHPAHGGLLATLHAVAPGQATISSAGGMICPSGQACPALARLWSLRVIVTQSGPARTYQASLSSSGRHYVLRRGDRLVVVLAGPSIYRWMAPKSSAAAVLARLSSTHGVRATATFSGLSSGTAKVTSVGNPACYPQCMVPSRLFEVYVTVVG